MQSETDVRVVLVTAPDHDAAVELVRALVGEELAACGNIVSGVTSIFRWEGEVQEDPEVLVILKVHRSVLPTLVERTAALHPYDVPEVLALPVTEGLSSYVEWVGRECGVS